VAQEPLSTREQSAEPKPVTPAAQTTALPRPRQDRQREIRYCKGRDGVRIAWTSSGHGPPILRAAHWMSHLQYDWDSPIWRHWIAALGAENTLIRYDERCNGMSDWEADDISFEAMLTDLEQVVEAAGLERFTLLGISQGCALSIAYAVRHPERVSGMILYGGYAKGWRARGDPSEIATREALATLMREGWGKSNALFRQLFSSLFIRSGGPEHLAALDELQRRTVSPLNAWRLQNTFSNINVEALLPMVKTPTLIMHARDDGVAPLRCGQIMAAEIQGARFIELDSMNHIMLEGEPAFDDFMDHLSAFVAETSGG
jgi:pimeloyl-ACP methyl ester carboxylesterase